MLSDFERLAREFDLWKDADRVASFWWRDDDAVAPTPALARLLDLSDAFAIEIGVAVIPAHAVDALSDAVARSPHAFALQHGYAHTNHGRAGAPAIELGGERPLSEILDELGDGFEKLKALFGARFMPILAAPWNHIEPRVLTALAPLGFTGASAFGPRAAMQGTHRLAIANAHVDPMNWKARAFAGTRKALSGIIGELEARRTGATDPDEPLGLLTHHLDHDEALWDFLPRFFEVTQAHPAARWLSLREAFATQAALAHEGAAHEKART